MMEPSRITAHARNDAHVAEGLSRLSQILRGTDAVDAILGSWLVQVQEVENALWALYGLGIDESEGAALDQVGVVLRQPRPDGMLDAVYRLVLHGVVVALKSSGTGDEVLRAVNAMLSSWDFALTEAYPATFIVEPDAAPSVPAAVLAAVLRRVKSGGVGLQVIDVPEGDTFAFSDDPETEGDDTGRGLTSDTELVGGVLVGVEV